MLNAYYLENIVDSVTFLLILFLGILIMAVLALLNRINRNEKLNRETLSKLDLLDRIVMNSSRPIVVIDDRGKVYLCNNEAARLLGKPKEEIEGDILDAFNLVTSSRNKMNQLHQDIRENKRFTFEGDVGVRQDRKRARFEVTGLSGSGSNARYAVGILPALDQSRENYEYDLLETRINEVENIAGMGYWIYTYDDRTTAWSRGMYKLLGKKINETQPDLSFFRQFAPESRNQAQSLLMAIKNHEPFEDRVVIIGDDGIRRVIDISVRHQDDLDMNIYKTMGIMREVTDEQELVDELKSSQEFWRNLGDREDIAIVATDRNSRIVFTNNYAAQVVNKTSAELLGQEITDYYGFRELPPAGLVTNSQLTYITSIKNHMSEGENIFLWSDSQIIEGDKIYLNINIGVNLTKCASNLELIQSKYNG